MDQNTATPDEALLQASIIRILRRNPDILVAALSEHLTRGETVIAQQLRNLIRPEVSR